MFNFKERLSCGQLLRLSITYGLRTSTPTNKLRFFTAVNHNYGDNLLTTKIQKPTNGSKSTNHSTRNNLLTPLSKTFLFSKRSAAVIDGSAKRNGWLNFERQSPHVIERRSNGCYRVFILGSMFSLNAM